MARWDFPADRHTDVGTETTPAAPPAPPPGPGAQGRHRDQPFPAGQETINQFKSEGVPGLGTNSQFNDGN